MIKLSNETSENLNGRWVRQDKDGNYWKLNEEGTSDLSNMIHCVTGLTNYEISGPMHCSDRPAECDSLVTFGSRKCDTPDPVTKLCQRISKL